MMAQDEHCAGAGKQIQPQSLFRDAANFQGTHVNVADGAYGPGLVKRRTAPPEEKEPDAALPTGRKQRWRRKLR
jgi:hypothetical protein